MTGQQPKHPVALAGHMDLRFNSGFQNTDTSCPHITWTGVITFGDDVYAITYQPTGPPEIDGTVFRFEEIWRIHDLSGVETADSVAIACGGDGLMWGIDRGEVDSNEGHADGTVQFVDPDGPFDDVFIGRDTHWSGVFSEDRTGFAGPFRID